MADLAQLLWYGHGNLWGWRVYRLHGDTYALYAGSCSRTCRRYGSYRAVKIENAPKSVQTASANKRGVKCGQ